MTEREKVIYSIERCICHVPDACQDCAYDADHPYNECVEMLLKDALELLKAQEPKPPRFAVAFDKIFYACDKCGKSLLVVIDAEGIKRVTNMPKYCPECGQAVKWDEL